MFVVNEDNSIYATRGDIVFFRVCAEDEGVKYTFKAGDVLRIKVYGKKDAENVVLQKDFPVLENTSEVEIYLTEEDTKIGEVISKPVDYWYEVELNPDEAPQTIIGYNEDGAVIFKLFPEGADVEAYEPSEEDFPVVDEELDMSSPRPVSNKAIARAFTNLVEGYEACHDAVSKLHVTPQMFGAVGDGVADDTEAIQAAIDTGAELAIPVGTYLISNTLHVKKVNQVIRGSSIDVVIQASSNLGDKAMLVLDGSASPAYRSNQQLSNLHLNGNGECVGLMFKTNADFFVSNVKVSNCKWGINSNDSLLYHVFGAMVIDCTNGIYFKNSERLSAANNVCFEMCKIIQIAKYAIYSESGNSTHNAVFKSCEIEATNTDGDDISPITLQSQSTSGASPIMVFQNCWFEQNNGTIPVLITGNDGSQKQYIFDGCTIMNAANACECFISATGRTLVMLNQSDPCTYTVASVKVRTGLLFIMGGIFTYDIDDENKVTHLGYDGFANSHLVFRNGKGTHYKSAGGTDHNKIYAQSNKLKIKADLNVVELDGAMGVDMTNNYLKPMILGTIYLWAHKEKIYCKYGSRPEAYNDGTVLITLE